MAGQTDARRRIIRSLIAETVVTNQATIRSVLADKGFEVTQATISRDLDAIGAARVKMDGGYRYQLAGAVDVSPARAALAEAVDEFVLSAATSGNLVVLRVPPGAAQFVASRIDAAHVDGVLGTIAGDDTILVVADEVVGADAANERIQGTEQA